MAMSRTGLITLIIGACVAIAAIGMALCGGLLYRDFRKADQAVPAQIDSLFAAVKSGDVASTYETHTSAELRAATSKEAYTEMFSAIEKQLGDLKSKSRRSLKVLYINGATFVDVTYAAKFETGDGTITARLKKVKGDWQFAGLNVNSPLFAPKPASNSSPSEESQADEVTGDSGGE